MPSRRIDGAPSDRRNRPKRELRPDACHRDGPGPLRPVRRADMGLRDLGVGRDDRDLRVPSLFARDIEQRECRAIRSAAPSLRIRWLPALVATRRIGVHGFRWPHHGLAGSGHRGAGLSTRFQSGAGRRQDPGSGRHRRLTRVGNRRSAADRWDRGACRRLLDGRSHRTGVPGFLRCPRCLRCTRCLVRLA